MRIVSDVGSVVGRAGQTHWGQVLLTPHAYGVVEIEEDRGGAMQLGVGVLSKLTHALSDLPSSLTGLEKLVGSIEGRWIRTIIILVPLGHIVYLVLRGRGCVYLKRGEKLARLVESEGGISGQVKEGDTLLLASEGFSTTLPQEKLTGAFDHLAAREVAEKLTLLVHEAKDGKGGAALIFTVQKLVDTESFDPSFSTETVAQPQPLHKIISALSRANAEGIRSVGAVSRRRLVIGAIAIVTALLFVGSIIFGIQKQQATKNNKEADSIIAEAQHAYEEGSALVELNPVKGRERLEAARDLVAPLVGSLSPRSAQGRQAADLAKQIFDLLTLALHSVKGEPQVFYDAGLLKQGSTISDLNLFEDTLVLLDTTIRGVYSVAVSSKTGQVVGGGDGLKGLHLVAIHGGDIFVLTGSGIAKIGLSDKKTKADIVPNDVGWGSIGSMVAYGGNLYLLDSAKGRIWKYVATDNGFSERREYLNPDTFTDFTKATSMAIDGSVWVGTADGKLLRFVQGAQQTFVPQGVEPGFGATLVVYTSDDTKNLYVLDSDNKRVVVLDKDGTYLAQYVWEGAAHPTRLLVSEQAKKILLLSEGKLYSLDLK